MKLTKNEAKKLAQSAKQITRQESDGRLIETPATYNEMIEDLSHCSRWSAEQYGSQVLVSATICSFTIEL